MFLSAKLSCFKQFDNKVFPNEHEIVKSGTFVTSLGNLEVYIIGLSHHLCWGDFYSERLYCMNEEIEADHEFVVENKIYRQKTCCGNFFSKVWFTVLASEEFVSMEAGFMNRDWSLLHCFGDRTALTGIDVANDKICTVHTYPEESTVMYSITSRDVNFLLG